MLNYMSGSGIHRKSSAKPVHIFTLVYAKKMMKNDRYKALTIRKKLVLGNQKKSTALVMSYCYFLSRDCYPLFSARK